MVDSKILTSAKARGFESKPKNESPAKVLEKEITKFELDMPGELYENVTRNIVAKES